MFSDGFDGQRVPFRLGGRSLERLNGVHPDLIRLIKRAIYISEVDFVIVQGLRTLAEQKANVAKGASQTMNSRHFPGKEGYGCAVDIAAWVENKIAWVPISLYHKIHEAFVKAGQVEDVKFTWGGSWKSLQDYGHFELQWAVYP